MIAQLLFRSRLCRYIVSKGCALARLMRSPFLRNSAADGMGFPAPGRELQILSITLDCSRGAAEAHAGAIFAFPANWRS